MHPTTTGVFDLAPRLRSQAILVAPGVYDPLSALIAAQAGCEALFLSGSAIAYSQLGRPDFGLGSATELVDLVARICERVELPLLVDVDQGFGNAAHVQRLVRGLCRSGAAALQIEDQLFPKPAGRLREKPLVPITEMVGKLKAAQDARLDDRFLISARTDATGFDETMARAEAYVEAGCDLLFIVGIGDAAQAARIVERLGGAVPLVTLLEVPGFPFADAAAAEAAGFALALFPSAAIGAAAHGLSAAFEAITRDGTSEAVKDRILTSAQVNVIVETSDFADRISRYGEPG